MSLPFELFFEVDERVQASVLEFADPSTHDLADGDRIQVVELLSSAPHDGDEVRSLEDGEMFGDGLTSHRQAIGELTQRLAIAGKQRVEQCATAFVGEGTEHVFHATILGNHMVACQERRLRLRNLTDQSARSATTGSTRAARRAGIQLAATVARPKSSTIAK